MGGDVRLQGGQIFAPAGRVELGSVAGSGTVGLNVNNSDLRLNFPDGLPRAEIFLNSGADVNVRAGGGGSIAVNAQNLNLAGESSLQAGIDSGLGSIDSQAGDIEINATRAIALTGESEIANTVLTGAIGKGGDIDIVGRSLSVTSGAALNVNTTGQGQGESLSVTTADSVQVSGASADGERFSSLTAQTKNIGNAGNITINTGNLLIENGAQVSTGTLGSITGNAGTITVNASDEVRVSGASLIKFFDSGRDGRNFSRLTTRTEGSGRAGNMTITTRNFAILNGAQVTTGTSSARGSGNGGNLTVNASDAVEVTGFATSPTDEVRSRLTTRTASVGNASNLKINTGNLVVRNKAGVSVDSINVTDQNLDRIQRSGGGRQPRS